MTEKQKIFADESLIDLNATRAYRVAYPSVKKEESAAVNGSKLLRNAKVAEYITERMEERQKRTEITQDRVLNELAAIAFSKASDYAKVVEKQATAEVDGNIIPLVGEDGEPILYREDNWSLQITLLRNSSSEPSERLKRGAMNWNRSPATR